MTTRVLFRCECCGACPDVATQRTLEGQLLDRSIAEYLDARPGGWLIWTGGGAFGAKRYACAQHRPDLTDRLRRQYGATPPIGPERGMASLAERALPGRYVPRR